MKVLILFALTAALCAALPQDDFLSDSNGSVMKFVGKLEEKTWLNEVDFDRKIIPDEFRQYGIDVDQWIHLRAAVRVLGQHVARLDPSAVGSDILARSAVYSKGVWRYVLEKPFMEPVKRLLDQYAGILRLSLFPLKAQNQDFVDERKVRAAKEFIKMLHERPRKETDEILRRMRSSLNFIDQYDEDLISFEKRMIDDDQIHFRAAIDFLNIFVPAMQRLLNCDRFDVMQLIAYRVIVSETPANPKDIPIPQTKPQLSKILNDLEGQYLPIRVYTPFCFRILFYSRAMQLGDQISPITSFALTNQNGADYQAMALLKRFDHESFMFLVSALHKIPGIPDITQEHLWNSWLSPFKDYKKTELMALTLAFDLQKDDEAAKKFGQNTEIAVRLLKQMNLPQDNMKENGNQFLVNLIKDVLSEEIKKINSPNSSPPGSPSPGSPSRSKAKRLLQKVGIAEKPVTLPTAKELADILKRFN